MIQLLNIVSDRGSRYAATCGAVGSRADCDAFLKDLKRNKKFAKATHNTWAALLPDGTVLRNDDGESGAAAVIVKMLEREALQGVIIVVTRWYGGVHLGGDRFAHVVTCTRAAIEAWRAQAI
ncbi:MAG: YigZ family protein [Cypionkella sp.]|nr:YigZ family protein [Cypionkella sp.]